MLAVGSPSLFSVRTSNSCNTLLRELQQIWSEIGETEAEKDRMIWELERECLEVYRRKVEEMANVKARLYQSVAAKEAELATLMAALGEINVHSTIQAEKRSGSLKEKLEAITPLVEDLRRKRENRMKQFADIKSQIEKISGEISEYMSTTSNFTALNITDEDLSLRKLTEYQTHLRSLQSEKTGRLRKVLEYVNEVHSLCGVLGLDFAKTVSEVHPSLGASGGEQSTNISNTTLDGLEKTILRLKAERKVRVEKIKDIVALLFELWKLMDSPVVERNKFSRIISVLRTSEAEIEDLGVLSTEMIEQASAEVERLTTLKASRMKELVMKRRMELEEICRMAHIVPDSSTVAEKSNALIDSENQAISITNMIDELAGRISSVDQTYNYFRTAEWSELIRSVSGLVNPSELLANIETQIAKVKDEAMSRKDIMDRIDKWLVACEEENWLEEYNRDDNRYGSGRGAHINLKRAEKARVTVTKIPGMVDNLINKTLTWEDEKGTYFLYDGARLVSILDDYKISRKRKEEEKRRSRDQKKLQDLLLTEKELIYGSKPSPRKSNSFRKPTGYTTNGNGSMTPMPRRNSIGNSTPETPRSYSGRQNGYHKEMRRLSTGPLNFVAVSKEDAMSSYTSICDSELGSPPPY